MLLDDYNFGESVVETIINQINDNKAIVTIKEYDTGKPINEVTGLPPLKSEMTQTRHKVDVKTQNQNSIQTLEQLLRLDSDLTKKTNSKISINESKNQQINTNTDIESIEKRGLNTVQQILCCLGILLLVAIIIWLSVRLKKRVLNH